jgi:hypothetical protein
MEQYDRQALVERIKNDEREMADFRMRLDLAELDNKALREKFDRVLVEKATCEDFWRTRFEKLKARMRRTDQLVELHVRNEMKRIAEKRRAKKCSSPLPTTTAAAAETPITEEEARKQVTFFGRGLSVKGGKVAWIKQSDGKKFAVDEVCARFLHFLCGQPGGICTKKALIENGLAEVVSPKYVAQLTKMKRDRGIVINEPFSKVFSITPVGRLVSELIVSDGTFV